MHRSEEIRLKLSSLAAAAKEQGVLCHVAHTSTGQTTADRVLTAMWTAWMTTAGRGADAPSPPSIQPIRRVAITCLRRR
ncbi:hypothetical protein BW733_00470 [Tessaracoccus flavescens]|uniref:Uncharacterized protein n=1 Tax=Tessaracoccus flavescens TaxID=399497 RepID=A0A1Q2CTW2_9ACTN|nr:hypothetical protein BW733_00470 [Tessaracoccus flavescens]